MDNSLIDLLIRIYIISGIIFCITGFIYTTFFSEDEGAFLKPSTMKKYSIEGFMEDTWEEPMTANELRYRFWCLEDSRTHYYKDFTMEWIEMCWNVKFILNIKHND